MPRTRRQRRQPDPAIHVIDDDTSTTPPLPLIATGPPAAMSTDDASSAIATADTVSGMDFINVPPPSFSGRSTDDAFAFTKAFERYVDWKGVSDDNRKRALFAVLLRDNAGTWYDTMADADKASYTALRAAFNKRYLSTDAIKRRSARDLFTKKQATSETVDDYVASVRRHALLIGANDEIVKYALLWGLKPHISAIVTQQHADTIDQIVDAARLAELTSDNAPAAAADSTIILDEIADLKAEIRRIGRERERERVNAVGPSRSPTPEQRHVSFTDSKRRPPTPEARYYNRAASGEIQGRLRAPPSMNVQQQYARNQYCYRCGRQNCAGQPNICNAYGKQCFSCGKFNHVARVCRAAQATPSNRPHIRQ